MRTVKSEVALMLDGLPDNSNYEDIQYHLYVLEKIKRGIGRTEAEGEIVHEEAKKRLAKWLSD